MNKKFLIKIIQEIVDEEIKSNLLLEDYKDEAIYKAFVSPFTDVIDTAKHGLKKIGAVTANNIAKTIKQAIPTFIPMIGDSVSKIGQEQEKKLQSKLNSIDKEYADVLKRNWDTLRSRDVSFLLFMMDPKIYLGSSLALKAPEVAFDVLDSLIDSPTVSKWHKIFQDLNVKVMPPKSGLDGSQTNSGFGSGQAFSDGSFGESNNNKNLKNKLLKEELTEDNIKQKAAVTLKRILDDKSIQRKIDNSPIVKEMQKEALKIFIEKAREVSDFKSVEEFKSFFGPDFDKNYKDLINKIDGKEKQNFNETLILELKAQYIQVIKKYLEDLISKSPGSEQEIKNAITEIERYL